MAVNTKGLCATIALICVIMPMIIGHCMPVGTEEKTVYELDNRINISGDLINDSVPTYQRFVSDYNNVPFLTYTPVSTTATNTNIPATNAVKTTVSGSVTIDPNTLTATTLYRMEDYPLESFSFSYGGADYDLVEEIIATPERGMIYIIGEDVPNGGMPILGGPYPIFTASANYEKTEYSTVADMYIDPSAGAYAISNDGSGGYVAPIWSNSYLNSRVGFLLELYPAFASSVQTVDFVVNGSNGGVNIQLIHTASGWQLKHGQISGSQQSVSDILGVFRQIYLEFDTVNNEVRLSALTRGDFASSPDNRIIKTVSFDLVPAELTQNELNDIVNIQLYHSTGTLVYDSIRLVCYDADIPYSSTQLITNQTFNPTTYYSESTEVLQITGNALYGSSITFPVIGEKTVSEGRITFDDASGEERTIGIRDMMIAATYDFNTDRYSLSLNGYTIGEDLKAEDLDISFNGSWLFEIYLSKGIEHTEEEYVFDFTTLNITMTEYAFIGMATAALAFVACAMIGRRSGTKVLSLLLISGLAFMIYTGMLL